MDPTAAAELVAGMEAAGAAGVAVGEEGSPKDWWSGGEAPSEQDLNSIHAANASCAAFHADVAAKHAAQLAQWVQYLWTQVASLQNKVIELEDWKKSTLDDMSKLRFEHKQLRRRLMPEGGVGGGGGDVNMVAGLAAGAAGRASLPLLLAEHVDSGDAMSSRSRKSKAGSASPTSLCPPPGLGGPGDGAAGLLGVGGSKRVSFASAGAAAAEPAGTGESPPAGSASELSFSPHSQSGDSELGTPTSVAGMEEGGSEGVHVTPCTVNGSECEHAEWRIGHLSTKLRGCMGRALVSSPFSAYGLEDLRLMVFPDGKEVPKGPRSRRQKELYAKKVSEGPLEGCLKLKVPDCPAPHTLEYYLKVGEVRKGPFLENFAESTVNGCVDFGVDWLQQVAPDQSLTVSVEIVKAGAAARGS